jgi:hypothetical protein
MAPPRILGATTMSRQSTPDSTPPRADNLAADEPADADPPAPSHRRGCSHSLTCPFLCATAAQRGQCWRGARNSPLLQHLPVWHKNGKLSVHTMRGIGAAHCLRCGAPGKNQSKKANVSTSADFRARRSLTTRPSPSCRGQQTLWLRLH